MRYGEVGQYGEGEMYGRGNHLEAVSVFKKRFKNLTGLRYF